MRIVAISDVHADARLQGRPRFEEAVRSVRASVAKAIEVDADWWVFAGDLADPDAGPVVFRCVQLLVEAVVSLPVSVFAFLVAGNHDVVEDGSGATVLSPLAPLEAGDRSLVVAQRPRSVPWSGTHVLHALPFTASSHPYDPVAFVEAIEDDGDLKHVFVSHLSVEGIQPGEETTEMPRGREVLLPREAIGRRFGKRATILQGHYHRRQRFDPGDWFPAVQVIGAPARFTFGEQDHDPGFLVIEV